MTKRDSVENAGDEYRLKKWRQDGYEKWDDTTVEDLRTTIIQNVDIMGAVDTIVIIVCGGTGHGTSSLINNCMAALSGTYSPIARLGCGQEHVTKQYKLFQSFTMKDGSVKRLPLIFADTRGFSENKREGALVAAIKACIMGKVVNGETIDPNITEEEWQKRKIVKSKVSYIFIVADATVISRLTTPGRQKNTLIRNLREIREFAGKEDIQVSAFLTKCDDLDPAVKTDPGVLHYSTAVQGAVTMFSPMIDVAVNRVFPVVNYTDHCIPSNEMMIQSLLALKHCTGDIVGDVNSNID